MTPVLGCDAADGIVPVCEFRNPEDIAATPSGDWLLVSQMADARTARGQHRGVRAAPGRTEVLFPVGEFDDVREWGDPDCAPPRSNSSPRTASTWGGPDGALQLLVVNHGGRESVEFLRVERSEEGSRCSGAAVSKRRLMHS